MDKLFEVARQISSKWLIKDRVDYEKEYSKDTIALAMIWMELKAELPEIAEQVENMNIPGLNTPCIVQRQCSKIATFEGQLEKSKSTKGDK